AGRRAVGSSKYLACHVQSSYLLTLMRRRKSDAGDSGEHSIHRSAEAPLHDLWNAEVRMGQHAVHAKPHVETVTKLKLHRDVGERGGASRPDPGQAVDRPAAQRRAPELARQ